MNSSVRRWRWASAALGLLCALLAAATILRDSRFATRDSEEPVESRKVKVERGGTAGSQKSVRQPTDRSQEERVQSRKLKVESGGTAGIQKAVRQPTDRSQKKSLENPKPEVDSAAKKIRDSRIATRDSGSVRNCQLSTVNCELVLRPLGYVEKAGGQVEAVVEEAGQVYIVHAGDTFADKFKVLAISRDEVQVAATLVRESAVGSRESEQPVESRELKVERRVAERSQKLETRSQNKSNVEIASGVLTRGVSESVARTCQLSTAECGLAFRDSQLSTLNSQLVLKPLGYVEKADGRVETIVADGEHVRLVRGEPALSARIGSRDSGLATRDSGEESGIQDSGFRIQEEPVASRKLKVDSPLAVAIMPPKRQLRLDDHEQAEFGLPDPLQPEAVAHFDRNPTRFLDLKDGLRRRTESVADLVADDLGERGLLDQMAVQPPENPDTPSFGPPIPHQIGYIERVVGQAEAIVAVGQEVHFVREGDVFADRFRALSVSPSWVEIEELPLGRKAPPEVFLGLVPALPDTPERRGSSSHSPPGHDSEEAKRTDLATGSGPPGQRPPPGAASGGFVPAVARASPRAGPVDAGLGPSAGRITLKPVGFAVKGDGETVAFVAVEGEVFLVREGEVLASRYKVLRVTATAVEIMPQTLDRLPEVARRPFGSSAGKPPAPTASNDNELISVDSITSARIGLPDLAGTVASAVSLGGERPRSGPGLSQGDLHSQAGMPDNSRNRR